MGVLDYSKIKVGVKTLEDATLDLGVLKNQNKLILNKNAIIKALAEKDLASLRNISNYFYNTNGVYQKVCNYYAFLYRYDWHIIPQIMDQKNLNQEKLIKEFYSILDYFDNSNIKQMCGEIALSVIKNGAYYGYIVPRKDGISLQELPAGYCRSRYKINGTTPAIEFNMKFFDDAFRDINYRLRVLKLFPPEFSKGYMLYKQNKLQPDYLGDTPGSWYLLEPGSAIKFSFYNGADIPIFANAIPAILDLDAAQDLDRRKQMQKLLKILIQKLPRDKNGDLIFDVDEARDIHNNAVEMLKRAVGVDVLTTFADIEVADMSDKNTTTSQDDLAKVERTVFNAFGTSQNIFNADGNIALNNSILQDESSVRNLLLQFEGFFNSVVKIFNPKNKKYSFVFHMLETTQYNYRELSKMYKEQTQLGYSKMLPQIALGHSQSSILHNAVFENQILELSTIMIPPLMSSTLNGEDLGLQAKSSGNNNKQNIPVEEKETGRPKKSDDEKSEKTIANQEALG